MKKLTVSEARKEAHSVLLNAEEKRRLQSDYIEAPQDEVAYTHFRLIGLNDGETVWSVRSPLIKDLNLMVEAAVLGREDERRLAAMRLSEQERVRLHQDTMQAFSVATKRTEGRTKP